MKQTINLTNMSSQMSQKFPKRFPDHFVAVHETAVPAQ